jgi:hypothetical protein
MFAKAEMVWVDDLIPYVYETEKRLQELEHSVNMLELGCIALIVLSFFLIRRLFLRKK